MKAVGWRPGASPAKVISPVGHRCPVSGPTMVLTSWTASCFTGGLMPGTPW